MWRCCLLLEMILSLIWAILSLIWEILSLIWSMQSPNFGETLSPERGEFHLLLSVVLSSWRNKRKTTFSKIETKQCQGSSPHFNPFSCCENFLGPFLNSSSNLCTESKAFFSSSTYYTSIVVVHRPRLLLRLLFKASPSSLWRALFFPSS